MMAAIVKAGQSPVTANSRARTLVSLWRLARCKRLPVPDGMEDFDFLRVPLKTPTAWLPDEMDRLLQSCLLARGRIGGIDAATWWVSFVLVLYDTGLRLSAAFAIRVDEVDFQNHMLRVPAERMKNRCEQYFRLSEQTLAAPASFAEDAEGATVPVAAEGSQLAVRSVAVHSGAGRAADDEMRHVPQNPPENG